MSATRRKSGEADALRREICQVEEMIRQLQETRSALLRKLNSLQASTASLPPETLTFIFECASPQDYDYICPSSLSHAIPKRQKTYPALTFSHVSSHWRQIVWSSPQLWNMMGVDITKKNADGIRQILELHLQNSKALPFSLNLSFRFRDAIPILLDSEYSGKIRVLQLIDPQLELLTHITTICPLLECLSIETIFPTSYSSLSFESASRLRHVRLREIYEEVLLPWSSITHISLAFIPIDTCAKLLTQCPNLVYFQSANPRVPRPESTPPSDITTLHHLQTLVWGYYGVPWCPAILQCVRLPALRMLSWKDKTLQRNAQPCVHALFTHLPDTLRNLELAYIDSWSLPLFRYAFSRCRHVQILTMDPCDQECVSTALCALCPGWEGDGVEYLPCLKSLTIGDRHKAMGYAKVLGTDFSLRALDICRTKHARPDPRFTLKLKGLKLDWAPGVREELRAMVRDGLQLDIWEDNVRVEWLM